MNYVPKEQWRRQRWRTLTDIGPTSELWVHHGATGQPNLATLRAYERYHVATRGWAALGYNWAITADGTIYEGRGWLKAGAHTSGRNTISHAVLLVGDWTSGRVPDAMVASLAEVAREGHRVGALTTLGISGGHRQAPGQQTSCPGDGGIDAVTRARRLLTEEFDMDEATLRKIIREEAGHAVMLHRFPDSGKGDGLDGASVQTALRQTARALRSGRIGGRNLDRDLPVVREALRDLLKRAGAKVRHDPPDEHGV